MLVDVHLDEGEVVSVLRLELVEDPVDRLAWAAPRGPEVDDHRSVCRQDVVGEAVVRDLDHAIRSGAGKAGTSATWMLPQADASPQRRRPSSASRARCGT